MIELRGITWNHTRGYLPMVATAQRFSELHPEIQISWEKRSLQAFADLPLERMSDLFDLLVIDHPHIGAAAENGVLLPLDRYLNSGFLADQMTHSVGESHNSYSISGHQWALAIDAATPVSGWRPDLLHALNLSPPGSWIELMELARRGLVVIPGIPIDTLMHLNMLCAGLGETPFLTTSVFISAETGIPALELLRQLAGLVSRECAQRNPIATWEFLTNTDDAAICPFAYGYSNYSRRGYAANVLETGGLIALEDGDRCRSTLGGAGLAISARCSQVEIAAEYCQFVASPDCQAGLYFQSGGQPGHRKAWLSADVNHESNNFFSDTLSTLDAAWLRPRWSGYPAFQDAAAAIVHKHIWGGGRAQEVIARLNQIAAELAPTHPDGVD